MHHLRMPHLGSLRQPHAAFSTGCDFRAKGARRNSSRAILSASKHVCYTRSMDTTMLSSATDLSDTALVETVKDLAACEREATATLVAHLAELDERRLYLAEGYSSMFSYCTKELHLSEHAAYGRIEAARAVRKWPIILERLRDGSVHLTTVGLLRTHFTDENHRDLLASARHVTRRGGAETVAGVPPRP